MTADVVTLLKKAHSMGADFWLENDAVWSVHHIPCLWS